jgi:TrmH family RNA methyltransferase
MITSSSNEQLKRLRRLRKRRDRDDEGVFLVEGYRQVRRAVDAGVEIEALFAAPDLYQGEGEAELAAALQATDVASGAFASITTRDRPDGLLAVARQFDTSLAAQRTSDVFLLVAEGVERPGNLGTMVRTACAAGVTGIVAADPQTDVFAPETVRASVGTLFAQPVSVAPADETAAWLQANGIAIVTASPEGDTAYWEVDLGKRPVAIVVGSEQHGVTPLWFDVADAVVHLPMAGVDSVNVAAAASVLLFDAVRQFRQGGW